MLKTDQVGDGLWDEMRYELVCVLRIFYAPPTLASLTVDKTESNTLLALFSGLTSVADWIGSMEEYFPYEEAPIDAVGYAAIALQRAEKAFASALV